MPQHLLSLISDCQGTTLENEMDPLKNLTIKSVKSIGINSIMLLTDNGLLFGHGNNGSGELGLGKEITSTEEFTQIPNLAYKTKLIECGYDSTYMIDELNQLYFTGIAIVLSEDEEQQFTFTKIEKFNENIKLIRVAFDVIFIVTENNLIDNFYFKPFDFVHSKIRSISATYKYSILYSHNNELIVVNHYNTLIDHIVLNLPSGMKLNSLFGDNLGSEFFSAFVTKENKIYTHKNNGGLSFDYESQVGDYALLTYSNLSNNNTLPYLKIIGMDYSDISISTTAQYSILYSQNNELIIIDHFKPPYDDYSVLNLPSGIELKSIYSNNSDSVFSSLVTKENKIYTHKSNATLLLDNNNCFGDFYRLDDSLLLDNLNLPYLYVVRNNYGSMLVFYTDYLINEDFGDRKNLNLFFVKLKNQLLNCKNLFIDIQFLFQ
ncbi:hypothetical protein ABK040_012416 [Willaertia magna]